MQQNISFSTLVIVLILGFASFSHAQYGVYKPKRTTPQTSPNTYYQPTTQNRAERRHPIHIINRLHRTERRHPIHIINRPLKTE